MMNIIIAVWNADMATRWSVPVSAIFCRDPKEKFFSPIAKAVRSSRFLV